LAAFGIGEKLRQERVGKGLAIDDISRDTRIARRFLEAIETDDYAALPGLVFTRNFVRQYALILNLDPDPLLAELPKQDESTARLPNPPARPRSSYYGDRRLRSLVSSVVWLLLGGGAAIGAYMHFTHSTRATAPHPGSSRATAPAFQRAAVEQNSGAARVTAPAVRPSPVSPAAPTNALHSNALPSNATAPVQVSVTAHDAAAWVQVSADGRITFSGTLKPNETREVSAAEQVSVLTGNAGALTISLNGKTLESLGPIGQVRLVKLTAEGPQFPSKAPPLAPDPL
jgi:cytoskeletal protein RodZ